MADDANERLARLEEAVSGVKSMLGFMQWVGGIGLGVLIAAAGWGIQRSFVVTDSLYDVRLAAQDGATRMETVQGEIKELKESSKGLESALTDVRLNVERIATAVGSQPIQRDPLKESP